MLGPPGCAFTTAIATVVHRDRQLLARLSIGRLRHARPAPRCSPWRFQGTWQYRGFFTEGGGWSSMWRAIFG